MKKIKVKQIFKRANKKDLDIIISYDEKYGGQTCTTGREYIILNDKEIIIEDDIPELTDHVLYQNIRWMKCCKK